MPGLGEGLSARDQHLSTYDDILRRVDAALWILDAIIDRSSLRRPRWRAWIKR